MPGASDAAATRAINATNPSSNIEPYPIGQAFHSLEIIFGVVPEAIKEWNPEMDPQAMVMKQNGKILPAKMGPVPSTKRVRGGSDSSGRTAMMPMASKNTTPSLTNVAR